MKRFSILIAALSLGLGTHASAWTGGPFDNGDYSVLLERGGVYQATFSFRNGSGMALFNENNSFEPASATSVTGMFSINNRSVFYYKGITYFGVATGIVDVDARRVTGFTNGNSDYAATTPATPGTATGAARPTNIGYNSNLSYTANSTFNAKITSTRPVMRFRGSGTVSFTGVPTDDDLSTALNGALGTATTDILADLVAGTITQAQAEAQINQIIGVLGATSNPSTPQSFQESARMRVYGSRRFF